MKLLLKFWSWLKDFEGGYSLSDGHFWTPTRETFGEWFRNSIRIVIWFSIIAIPLYIAYLILHNIIYNTVFGPGEDGYLTYGQLRSAAAGITILAFIVGLLIGTILGAWKRYTYNKTPK